MIKVENLVKAFGPKLAVNDVSFTVERGEVLGEESAFAVRVVARRGGAPQIGKARADPGPEITIGSRRHRGSSLTLQFHAPTANARRRRLLVSIRSPAASGASAG